MSHRETLDLQQHREPLLKILTEVVAHPDLSRRQLDQLLRDIPKGRDGMYSRDELISAYRSFAGDALPSFEPTVIERLRRKPVRTSSGVTPVTVLTKPFPCPGECIFCPNDVRMPKSYLSDEPGAQRAEQNGRKAGSIGRPQIGQAGPWRALRAGVLRRLRWRMRRGLRTGG